jgi:hypothetical protein
VLGQKRTGLFLNKSFSVGFRFAHYGRADSSRTDELVQSQFLCLWVYRLLYRRWSVRE